MRTIPLTEADWHVLGPILQKRADDDLPPFGSEWKIFLNMRSSGNVLVFSSGYLVAMNDWWSRWKEATGFRYENGSQECEAGVKILIGHINESLQPFRGEGQVPQSTITEAQQQGVSIPNERLGDFTPGLYEIRLRIPAGVDVNGVTDAGHSTVAILVEYPDGKIVLLCYEWQVGRWTEFETVVKNGCTITDVID